MNASTPTVLEIVQGKLDAIGHRCWPSVAEHTGVPLTTIVKLGRRYTKNPCMDTMQPLINYFHIIVKPGR